MSDYVHMMDQRCDKRIDSGEKVDFRCNNDEDFRAATMVDFSESGMLLMMSEKHTEGTQFEVRINIDESIYFTVKCMRVAHYSDINSFSYGCQIEDHRLESSK